MSLQQFLGFDPLALHDFKFSEKLLLANWNAIFIAVASYLVVVFGLKEFIMKDRKRVEFHWAIVPAHNFFLSALSLVMMLGMIFEIGKIYLSTPAQEVGLTLFCDVGHRLAKGLPEFWFYIFYLSKFYELLDTVIIALKKNPIIFLHVYHHIITIALVYIMLDYSVAVRWISAIANALVHVPMYYYYGMSALGHRIWWKKYMTTLQIVQFVIDLAANSVGFVYMYQGHTCSGSLWAWLFGQGILLSFLILFISFYKSTYKAAANAGAKKHA